MVSAYYSAEAPDPSLKSGKSTVTVRMGGRYEVYACVGKDRVPMRTTQAWALWVALGNALAAEAGPIPDWAAVQITHRIGKAAGPAPEITLAAHTAGGGGAPDCAACRDLGTVTAEGLPGYGYCDCKRGQRLLASALAAKAADAAIMDQLGD